MAAETRKKPSDCDFTPAQRAFVSHVLADPARNLTAAYAKAYPNNRHPEVSVHALLQSKPELKAYLEEKELEIERKAGVTRERVLREEARIAFADTRRLIENDGLFKPIDLLSRGDAAMIAGIKKKRVRSTTRQDKSKAAEVKVEEEIIEIKLNSRGQALARLERVMGMNVDQVRVGMLDTLPEDELDRRLAELEAMERSFMKGQEDDEGQVIDVSARHGLIENGYQEDEKIAFTATCCFLG